MAKARKRKRPLHIGRQPKHALEAWVVAMQFVIGETIRGLPEKQQVEVLDGLQQAIVQRLNWLRERSESKRPSR